MSASDMPFYASCSRAPSRADERLRSKCPSNPGCPMLAHSTVPLLATRADEFGRNDFTRDASGLERVLDVRARPQNVTKRAPGQLTWQVAKGLQIVIVSR